MHQQQRAIEQPFALKIASRSDHRAGVRGWTVSFTRGGIPISDLSSASTKNATHRSFRRNLGRLLAQKSSHLCISAHPMSSDDPSWGRLRPRKVAGHCYSDAISRTRNTAQAARVATSQRPAKHNKVRNARTPRVWKR